MASAVRVSSLDERILQALGAFVACSAVLCVVCRIAFPATAKVARTWRAASPHKDAVELTFLAWSVGWIGMVAVIVATAAYEHFGPWEYFWTGITAAAPCWVLPALTSRQAVTPWWDAYWFKINVWIGILSFVGNYVWTHYFYTLLHADYTFDAWRVNNVPIAMFLMTHAYFCLYHTLTNMALRRWYTSLTYASLPRGALRTAASAALVTVMAWVTAFMETFTIQGFPYYRIENREYMYTVGSIVYGLYFVVSFPMHLRVEEDTAALGRAERRVERAREDKAASGASVGDAPASGSSSKGRARRGSGTHTHTHALTPTAAQPQTQTQAAALDETTVHPAWPLSQVCIDSLGGCMLVTLLLDAWRIAYTAAKDGADGTPAQGLVWFG